VDLTQGESEGFDLKLKVQIPCHKDNQKLINSDYIYRISYRNAKKANPMKWICPIEKTISRELYML
jgi:hypothetical protein